MVMKKVKFVLVSTEQKADKTLAGLEISPRGENFYCRLELGGTAWAELRRLIRLNYWMEWDYSDGRSSPKLRLARRAFADGVAIPRNAQQSAFAQRLPGILQKDSDGWRVVDYAQSNAELKLTFAHASQMVGNEDDLVQVQIDFTRHFTCQAIYD